VDSNLKKCQYDGRSNRVIRPYVASCRKRLTLYMVTRAVGDEEMMMIGWKLPIEISAKRRHVAE